ncbi:MAG: hypothetical protein NZM09_08930, partial [Ignavibacterium sp.]|nr:hypothetical protein [Ignavibacterium sp.]MDW8375807.1 hypothetical protein [Ignavibacteriales bacterium]
MNFEIDKLETELKKRLSYPYKWGLKQNDELDKKTNFIYKIFSFDELLIKIEKSFDKIPEKDLLFNYSLNRWFNFWSARAVQSFFISHSRVKPAEFSKDKVKDFYIDDIPFDHKTSVYPRKFRMPFVKAKENPKPLIKWFYKNQSQQQRKHFANRLFVVVYSESGEHWKV